MRIFSYWPHSEIGFEQDPVMALQSEEEISMSVQSITDRKSESTDEMSLLLQNIQDIINEDTEEITISVQSISDIKEGEEEEGAQNDFKNPTNVPVVEVNNESSLKKEEPNEEVSIDGRTMNEFSKVVHIKIEESDQDFSPELVPVTAQHYVSVNDVSVTYEKEGRKPLYTTLKPYVPPASQSLPKTENEYYLPSPILPKKDVFASPNLPPVQRRRHSIVRIRPAKPTNRGPGTPYPHAAIAAAKRNEIIATSQEPRSWPQYYTAVANPVNSINENMTFTENSTAENHMSDSSESSTTSLNTNSFSSSGNGSFEMSPSLNRVRQMRPKNRNTGVEGEMQPPRILGTCGEILQVEDDSGYVRYVLPMLNERENHNIKERKRRGRVSAACSCLRYLVPGLTAKTDKASVFEYTAEYLKFLKSKVGGRFDQDFMESSFNS